MVIDGWIFLQVARRIDSLSDSGSTRGKNGIASDATRAQQAVDYQLARRKGKFVFQTFPSISRRFLVSLIAVMCALWVCLSNLPILNSFFFFILAAKEGALDVLGQILEFDVSRLLHHFERFVGYNI